jgi:hypothetical protein
MTQLLKGDLMKKIIVSLIGIVFSLVLVNAVQAATITMTASNVSWLNPMWGTPAATPIAGNDYVMAYVGTTNPGVMRVSPYNSTGNGNTSFPGNSITVENQCRFLMKQYGGETVTINGGSGNLIVNAGGRISLAGNNPGAAGTVTLDIGQLNVTGNCLVDMNNAASGLLVSGTLTGAGPMTIQKEASNTARSFATFANVSNYTGDITVGTYIDLGFGVNCVFPGTLTLNSNSTLKVDHTLTFQRILINGAPVEAGTYSGSSLTALNSSLGATYLVDGGGTLTVVSGDLAVSYTVNTEQERAAISPYIYGSSLRFDVLDDCLTIMRFGGNHTTPYNWENNCNNAGKDWYHVSGRIGSSTVPGAAVVDHADKARARGQESLITLPMAGYVAADAAGEVTEAQTAPSSRFTVKDPLSAARPAIPISVTGMSIRMSLSTSWSASTAMPRLPME